MTCSVDDSVGAAQAISNDITAMQFSLPRGVQDATGINSTGPERILLLADFSITINGIFNDAANMSHAVFKTVSSTSVTRTVAIAHSGQTLNNECIFTDYSMNRANDGSLTWTAAGQLNSQTAPTWS